MKPRSIHKEPQLNTYNLEFSMVSFLSIWDFGAFIIIKGYSIGFENPTILQNLTPMID